MRRTVALVSGFLMLLVACGDDSGTASAGDASAGSTDDVAQQDPTPDDAPESEEQDIDPCSLLDVSDIEAEFGDRGDVRLFDVGAELGIEIEVDDSSSEAPPDTCGWLIGDVRQREGGQVTLTNSGPGGVDDLDFFRENYDAVETDGIGEAAVYYSFVEGEENIQVTSGGIVLGIAVILYDSDPDGVQEELENLARKVVDRL